MTSTIIPIRNIFQDNDYAWNLLQKQILLETSQNICGDQIANLLAAYMQGVEIMNSIADSRQSYFKNKVTQLMMKQSVINSFNSKSMKKKKKPKEIQCIEQKNVKQDLNQTKVNERKKQFTMRLAYENHETSTKKIMIRQEQKQINLKNKIDKIIQSHEQKLNDRIKKRRLKATTSKTYSEMVIQDQNPIQGTINLNLKKGKIIEFGDKQKQKKTNRRVKSLGALNQNIEIPSPSKRRRKLTEQFSKSCPNGGQNIQEIISKRINNSIKK